MPDDTGPAGAAEPRSFEARDFVQFFDRRGRSNRFAGDHLWYESARFAYQSFPYHRMVDQPAPAIAELFKSRRVLAARFPTTPDANGPTGSLFIARPPYSIDQLSSNTRSRVRRGLRNCVVEQVAPRTLREEGIALVASTATRQHTRFGRRQADDWQSFCDAAAEHPAWEAWTARVDGRLAALAMCFVVEDCFQVSTVRSDAELLNAYPNNALLSTLMSTAFDRPGIALACYGLSSLDRGTGGLHDFKLSMGFDAVPVADNIVTRVAFPARAATWCADRLTAGEPSHRAAQLGSALRAAKPLRAYLR